MKIILLIPYLGKLPGFFGAFLHSLRYIKKGNPDILIITDDNNAAEFDMPDCMRVQIMSSGEMTERIHKVTGYKLTSGYKLCDFRPAYGEIFAEECSGYDYWGYCDLDTMMGDLFSWWSKIGIENYDRIGKQGHLTIYKNNEKINRLWKTQLSRTCNYKYVFNTTYPCNFDEIGMNKICEHEGVKFYDNNNCANIEPFESLHFKEYRHKLMDSLCQFFTWEKGKVYVYTKDVDGCIKKEEKPYLHFMCRKEMQILEPIEDEILITHLGFKKFYLNKIEEYFEEFGRQDTPSENENFIQNQRKMLKVGKRQKLIRELQTYGLLKTLFNLYLRLRS